MKMFEILNQVKATLEGVSVDESWQSLGREVERTPRALRRFLEMEHGYIEALQIYHRLIKQMKLREQAEILKKKLNFTV